MLRPSSLATVSVSRRRFAKRDLPLPEIGNDDALLQVERCGLCGADLEQYRDGLMSPYPYIPGHEPVGTIAVIGDGAATRWGFDVGDRVVVEAPLPCRECAQCVRVAFDLCSRRRNLGFISADVELFVAGTGSSHPDRKASLLGLGRFHQVVDSGCSSDRWKLKQVRR